MQGCAEGSARVLLPGAGTQEVAKKRTGWEMKACEPTSSLINPGYRCTALALAYVPPRA